MASFKRFAFLFSYISIWARSVARAEAPGLHLVRQASNDHLNPIDEQLRQAMKWSHGGYVLMDRGGGRPPVFYTLDRDGNLTDTAQFQNPEPTRFASYSYDRQSNGTVVFSGATYTDPHVLSPFLAWTSSNGKIQRLLHLEHYLPSQVAVAPDNTIWTLGFEMVEPKLERSCRQQRSARLATLRSRGKVDLVGFSTISVQPLSAVLYGDRSSGGDERSRGLVWASQ